MKCKFRFPMISIILIFLAINYFPDKMLAAEINTIQESEDIVVVTNPKMPETKMRIVFTEELSIGEAEGDENYMFGQNIFFNTDNEGDFYVSDVDAHKILKYDPDGKYLLTIGREGQGPGEFGSLSFIGFDKDNNIYINDAGNNRISFFDKEGKYLKQIRMTERYPYLIINSKGIIIANKFVVSEEGNIQKISYLYGLFDNDFIYLGYSDKYEINVYSPEGKLVKKINRDYDPIPVSKKDKESYVKRISENLPSVFTEDIREKAFKNVKYPKYKPAYQGFTLMENGWLAVIVDSVEDEYTLLDIFDKEGKYIAQFKTPVPAEGMLAGFLFFKNGKAYSVVTEDEYKFAKRYSIEIQEFKDNKWVRKK